MRRSTLDSLAPRIADSLAIAAIAGYQRYLSPYKGFRCAHRVLYRGESCSQYVKRVVQAEGLGIALQKSRVRFAECKEANQLLQARRKLKLASVATGILSMSDGGIPTPEDIERADRANGRRSPQRKKDPNFCSSQDCDFCCQLTPDCSGCDTSGLDCNGCDFPGGDCGDCGNIGDCGSCGN